MSRDGALSRRDYEDLGKLARRQEQVAKTQAEQWGKLLTWAGSRWEKDVRGGIVCRMAQTARSIYAEAAEAETKEQRKAIVDWAKRSEAEARINAAINLYQARLAAPCIPGRRSPEWSSRL